ncbi:MAG: hypothetical protein LUF68_00160 [Clostridiales bacterium]|nr:hypothetical protein [Clostridiales bacterium]
MMVQFPQCLDCENFIQNNPGKEFTCKAFPNGIPDDIFWNKILHSEHIDGDHGIIFVPVDKADETACGKEMSL